jgi:hypothetical protein
MRNGKAIVGTREEPRESLGSRKERGCFPRRSPCRAPPAGSVNLPLSIGMFQQKDWRRPPILRWQRTRNLHPR